MPMIIPGRIANACAGDPTRWAMDAVRVRKGVAIATDGRMIAWMPVEGDPEHREDVLVPASAFGKKPVSVMVKRIGGTVLQLLQTKKRGSVKDPVEVKEPDQPPPPVDVCLPDDCGDVHWFAVDAGALHKLASALCDPDDGLGVMVGVCVGSPRKPLQVLPLFGEGGGVLMPMNQRHQPSSQWADAHKIFTDSQ